MFNFNLHVPIDQQIRQQVKAIAEKDLLPALKPGKQGWKGKQLDRQTLVESIKEIQQAATIQAARAKLLAAMDAQKNGSNLTKEFAAKLEKLKGPFKNKAIDFFKQYPGLHAAIYEQALAAPAAMVDPAKITNDDFKQVREYKRMSTHQMAAMMGISVDTLEQVEGGQRRVNPFMAKGFVKQNGLTNVKLGYARWRELYNQKLKMKKELEGQLMG